MTASAIEVVQLIRSVTPNIGHTRVVCIDGPAGAGKTTLAAFIAQRMPHTQVIHMDDLYDGWTDALDEAFTNRLIDDIMTPLIENRPISYLKYDWAAGEFGARINVPSCGVLVLEGVGSAQSAVRKHAALTVFIDIPPTIGAKRVKKRDGNLVAQRLPAWQLMEQKHFATDHTAAMCDVKISGEAF